MHPVEQHYRERLKKWEGRGEEDYGQLDQGLVGTTARHFAVVSHTPRLEGRVLDVGCGTGLLWDMAVGRGRNPEFVQGLDILEERIEPFSQRMSALSIQHKIKIVDPHEPVYALDVESIYDCILVVGLAGYVGLQTHHQIRCLVEWMRSYATHGAISFPVHHPDVAPVPYLQRFDPVAVKRACQSAPAPFFFPLERELLVTW